MNVYVNREVTPSLSVGRLQGDALVGALSLRGPATYANLVVSIGFLREVWVFVNGKLVYADKNLYQAPGQRKDPDGRLSIENGSFNLPLHKGANHVVVAIRSNTPEMQDRYGWGIEMRLEDLKGVTAASVRSPHMM
jgi:hypothetical protein